MASSIKLYTLSDLMDVIKITSVTPAAASNYAKELMLDNNPDTYYKAANHSSAFDVLIDLGSAKIVQSFAIWYRNHLSLSPVSTGYFYYSDNGTDWTCDSLMFPQFGESAYANYPCRLYDVTTATAHRYWRYTHSDAAPVDIQISGIWFLKKHDIGQGSQYPENDRVEYFNRTHKAAGGRRLISAINKNAQTVRPRKFLFGLDTNFNQLLNAFQESCGSRWPIFYRDSESPTYGAKMCQLTQDAFEKAIQSYKIYEPSITLEEFVYNDPTYGY